MKTQLNALSKHAIHRKYNHDNSDQLNSNKPTYLDRRQAFNGITHIYNMPTHVIQPRQQTDIQYFRSPDYKPTVPEFPTHLTPLQSNSFRPRPRFVLMILKKLKRKLKQHKIQFSDLIHSDNRARLFNESEYFLLDDLLNAHTVDSLPSLEKLICKTQASLNVEQTSKPEEPTI